MAEETRVLSERQEDFLKKLADLCEEYNAGIDFCKIDDTTLIRMDGEVVFAGFIDEKAADELRKALSTGKVTVTKSFS
ncbi:MAG: hypothetical protein ACXW0T_06635 [Methylobacter sp.]